MKPNHSIVAHAPTPTLIVYPAVAIERSVRLHALERHGQHVSTRQQHACPDEVVQGRGGPSYRLRGRLAPRIASACP